MRTSGSIAVTGVTGTLGWAVAQRFVKSNWHVSGCARDSINWEHIFNEKCQYPDLDVRKANVLNQWAMRDWMNGLKPYAIVTCAGISNVASIHDQSLTFFLDVIQTNLTGTWVAVKEAVRAGAKRIVTIGSIHGCTPTSYPNRAAYTASKGGVAALTQALAVELAPQGIVVNCVAPGHLPSLMPGTKSGEELLRAAAAWTPLGRLTTPEEVAGVIYWLVVEAPEALTGNVIVVDGAFSRSTWPMEVK